MLGAVGMEIGGQTGDRYKLLASLGSGAFGDAWKAHDQDEDSIVAVKLLDPETHADDVLREASLQRRLSRHPRIVALRNVELGANPSSFVVSELVPGGSIQDLIEQRRPTVLETHRWLRDTLEALAHAHGLNVLHRDIKPSNLLLGADGHALLTDFGVAEDSVARAARTPGMYPLTLPPEFGTTPTTVQTDLWLVGILAWQLLVGERPDLSAAHAGRLELVHRRSPEVPIALSRAIALGLEPDPARRPESAERMLEAVSAVPIRCGWHDVAPSDPSVVRAWTADAAGGGVTVEVRRRKKDFLVRATAPPGSRLRAKRRAIEPSEKQALKRARSWLEPAVRGFRL